MTNKMNVRKGDDVIIIAGKDKGKEGQVIKVLPSESRVIIQGVNVVKRHTKPSAENPQGGIVKKEASIHVSNIMHRDPESGKPTRIGRKFLKNGQKIRFAKKSGSTIEVNRT